MTTEFIVELLVVVEADTREQAEKVGLAAARRAWRSARIKNVLLVEVRGDDDEVEQ